MLHGRTASRSLCRHTHGHKLEAQLPAQRGAPRTHVESDMRQLLRLCRQHGQRPPSSEAPPMWATKQTRYGDQLHPCVCLREPNHRHQLERKREWIKRLARWGCSDARLDELGSNHGHVFQACTGGSTTEQLHHRSQGHAVHFEQHQPPKHVHRDTECISISARQPVLAWPLQLRTNVVHVIRRNVLIPTDPLARDVAEPCAWERAHQVVTRRIREQNRIGEVDHATARVQQNGCIRRPLQILLLRALANTGRLAGRRVRFHLSSRPHRFHLRRQSADHRVRLMGDERHSNARKAIERAAWSDRPHHARRS
mmetsp:Transcript_5771/g.18339  ORF Transcript_5771/g.18339 Transcript_5771/m.18339 type:complete len:311 (+) Transcript_5771:268-1200(+)